MDTSLHKFTPYCNIMIKVIIITILIIKNNYNNKNTEFIKRHISIKMFRDNETNTFNYVDAV